MKNSTDCGQMSNLPNFGHSKNFRWKEKKHFLMPVVSIVYNFKKISSINFMKISKELILGLQMTHLPDFEHNMNFHWNLIQNSVASSITKLFPMIFHDLKTFLVFSITFKFKILIFLMTKAKQIRRFWHIIWTRISSLVTVVTQ